MALLALLALLGFNRFRGLRVSCVGVILLAAALIGCGQGAVPAGPTPEPTPETAFGADHQPNIIIMLTDDQRYDTMDYMPQTKALIFDRGVNFTRAYATTPLCCPSRASILTGMNAHSTGVRTNDDELNRTTFAERLHQAGYYTGFIGKYLNSWGGSPRPEFDFWVGMPRYDYFNPRLNVNGDWQVVPGYLTTILGQYALEFIEQASKQHKPWLLYYAPTAPHGPSQPDTKYEKLYSDLPPFRPASYNPADISGTPFADKLPLLTDAKMYYTDFYRLQQLRCLKSVDDTVGDIMHSLDQHGMAENTATFYLSDNGMMWGEHRLAVVKVFPYEPSIRLPFAFYFPRLTTSPNVISKLVGNIDIAPTIYELAGIAQPPEVEGSSLIPLMRGQGMWRDWLMIESWGVPDTTHGEPPATALSNGKEIHIPYVAIHTDRYIYVQNIGLTSELYDLDKDPDEMVNQIDNPDYVQVAKDLAAKDDFYRGPFMTQLEQMLAATPTPPSD